MPILPARHSYSLYIVWSYIERHTSIQIIADNQKKRRLNFNFNFNYAKIVNSINQQQTNQCKWWSLRQNLLLLPISLLVAFCKIRFNDDTYSAVSRRWANPKPFFRNLMPNMDSNNGSRICSMKRTSAASFRSCPPSLCFKWRTFRATRCFFKLFFNERCMSLISGFLVGWDHVCVGSCVAIDATNANTSCSASPAPHATAHFQVPCLSAPFPTRETRHNRPLGWVWIRWEWASFSRFSLAVGLSSVFVVFKCTRPRRLSKQSKKTWSVSKREKDCLLNLNRRLHCSILPLRQS